jgi:very-short-patch-repair endonuclease
MDPSRALANAIEKKARRAYRARRLQKEAATRPESTRVETPGGAVWMSPIEAKLYEAMKAQGLAPIPQFCVEGYFVDFAFPDLRLAVEADGAAFHGGDRRQRDRKRDWILGNAGWTVQRFHGATIYDRPGNCAYVVKRQVEERRANAQRIVQEAQQVRRTRRDAILRPFRRVISVFRRRR